MQTVTQPEQLEQEPKKRTRKRPTAGHSTVAFRCPMPLRVELDVRVARDRSSVQDVCIAALEQYLDAKGKAA